MVIRRRPLVEILEGRMLLTVGFDPGTATFTGDGTAHTLLLSEDLSGFLAYTVDPDTDAETVVTTIPITSSSPPTITVDLGDAGNTLRLDNSWTFTDPITFTGGAGGDTLDDETGTADTWTLTSAQGGNINDSVTFTAVATALDPGHLGTLIGDDNTSTWTIGSSPTYSDGSGASHLLAISGFGTLQGGSGANTFAVTGDNNLNFAPVNLTGGSGDNTFAFTNSSTLRGNIVGGSGGGTTNTLDYSDYGTGTGVTLTGTSGIGYTGTEPTSITGTFRGINSLVGWNSGSDTLSGRNAANTWSLGTTDSYQAGSDPSLVFSGFNELDGGNVSDSFNVTLAQTEITTIVGKSTAATLDLSGYASGETVTLNTFDPNDSFGFSGSSSTAFPAPTIDIPYSFTGISDIIGRGGDTLVGEDVASTWTLSGSPTYTDDNSNHLTFSGFGTLQGGSGADAFVVTVATTDALKGGTGTDTLDLRGFASGETVTLSGYSSGFSGSTSSATGSFTGMDAILGRSGDTLAGRNVASTWTLDGSPSYSDGSHSLAISGFNTLQGGSGADAFVVTVATADALNGGTGADTLDLSGFATGQTVTLTDADATGFGGTTTGSTNATGGFLGIDSLVGASGDTLTGENVDSTWTLDGSPYYSAGSNDVAFSGFGTLQGRSGNDDFVVTVATTDTLKGGGGADTLDLSGFATVQTVTLTGSGSTGFTGTTIGSANATGGFQGIDSLVGTSDDTLVGEDVDSNWALDTISNYNDLNNVVDVSGFGTLQGGSGDDLFVVSVATTPVLNGGSGVNTLDLTGYDSGETVTLSGYGTTGFSGSTSSATGNFTDMTDILGASGDTLVGEDVDSIWTFDGSPTYTDNNSNSLALSGFTTLQGGSGADNFVVSVATSDTLNGGGGSDTLDLSGFASGQTVTLISSGSTGFGGITTSATGGFQGIDSLIGVFGDTLTGEDIASTWALGGSPTYTDNNSHSVAFSGFGTLQGGEGADDFVVTVATAAALDGGIGADTLDLSGFASGQTVTLTSSGSTGFDGTTTGSTNATGGFRSIDIVSAVSGDTLAGRNVASTWTLNNSPHYSDGSQSLSFSGFGILQGGSGGDNFVVTVITPDVLKGGSGGDTLDLTGFASGETVTLSGYLSAGFSGTTSSATGGFTGMDAILGRSGDTLTGEGVASTWTLNNSPSYSDGSHSLAISGFNTLQGGSGDDNFVVTVATTDTLNGGTGSDTLDLSGFASGQTVTLSNSSSSGFSGSTTSATGAFAGIDVISGVSGDTLAGRNVASTWTISGSPSYNEGPRSLSFSGFATLQGGSGGNTFNIQADTSRILLGGSGNDSFAFANGKVSTGTIDGQGGTDTLDYSAYTTAVTVNVGNLTATATSTLLNVEGMIGGVASTSTLIGANATNTWSITGTNAGSISGPHPFSFSNVGNLTGGILNDTFTFSSSATESGTLSGGSGTNTLDFHNLSTGVTVNISTNNGGSSTANSTSFNFSGIANLVGGTGNNTFALGNGKTISGTIDGGSGGTNTINYSAWTTGVRVNLSQNAAVGVYNGAAGGLTNFRNVTGGNGGDILIGNNAGNVLIDGNGNNVVVGGSGNNTITVGNGRNIVIGGAGTSTLNAGTGQNILIADSTTYDLNLAALTSLMAEWGRTDVNYLTRFGHISGSIAGGRNGSYLLNTSTITPSTHVSTVTVANNADLQWYIAPAIDDATIPSLRTVGGVTEKRTTR